MRYKQEIDEFSKHEVVHTASMFADMISKHLLDHPAVQANPKWRGLSEVAFHSMWKLYYELGLETVTEQDWMRRAPVRHLKHLITLKSFRRGKFTLASGQETSYFFNLKPTMLDAEASNIIADLIIAKMEDISPYLKGIAAVGGMATGGIPLVSVVSAKSFVRNTPVRAFFVRTHAKDHGTEQIIEGEVGQGETVILAEDVTTTGGSIMHAVRAVRAAGAVVEHVITVIDRLEGAADNLKAEGITLHPILLRSDFDDVEETP